MFKSIINWIKRKICAEELDALNRYRVICWRVNRLCTRLENSSETARFISEYGDGIHEHDISILIDKLLKNKGKS